MRKLEIIHKSIKCLVMLALSLHLEGHTKLCNSLHLEGHTKLCNSLHLQGHTKLHNIQIQNSALRKNPDIKRFRTFDSSVVNS